MHEIGMWDGNIQTALNQSASNVRHVEKSVLKRHLDLCGVQKEKNSTVSGLVVIKRLLGIKRCKITLPSTINSWELVLKSGTPTLQAWSYTSVHPEELEKQLRIASDTLEEMFIHFQAGDSEWALERNIHLCLNIAEYQPFRASPYIPLPTIIEKKKAAINMKNEDKYCFMWANLGVLHPVSIHPERVSHYQRYRGELNFEGIQFPVSCEGIKKFKRQNPSTIVTVIGNRGEEKRSRR